jgi:MFS family permease
MLFFGKTADLFGRKVQLLGGMTFLSLVSLVISFAPNSMAVNVLCGFLGLGSAVIAPPSIGILISVYSEGRRRNKAMGVLACGNPLGFVLGSISSGVATKYFSWRASFRVVSIFFFVMTIVSIWTVPMVRRAGNTRTLIKQFDYLGTALTITGMAFISSALT